MSERQRSHPRVRIEAGPAYHDFKLFMDGAEVKNHGVQSADFRTAFGEDPVVSLRLVDVGMSAEGRLRLPLEHLRELAAAEGFELTRKREQSESEWTDSTFPGLFSELGKIDTGWIGGAAKTTPDDRGDPVMPNTEPEGRDLRTCLRVAPDGRLEIGDVLTGDGKRLVPFAPGRWLTVTVHGLSETDFVPYHVFDDLETMGAFTISHEPADFVDEAKATLDEADKFHEHTTDMVRELRCMRDLLSRIERHVSTPPRGD